MHDDLLTADIARMYLRDVEPMWKAFWFHMHLVAKNLEEFSEGLRDITDEVFAYHVSGDKNDLAKWVHEVIGDPLLARQLSEVASKEAAADIVARRVAALRATAEKHP